MGKAKVATELEMTLGLASFPELRPGTIARHTSETGKATSMQLSPKKRIFIGYYYTMAYLRPTNIQSVSRDVPSLAHHYPGGLQASTLLNFFTLTLRALSQATHYPPLASLRVSQVIALSLFCG
jgi:hypothetical protein